MFRIGWGLHISETYVFFCGAVGGRALVLGRLWRQDGTLAVSVAQEGVVRGKLADDKPTSKL